MEGKIMKKNIDIVNNYDDFKKVFDVFKGYPFFEDWKDNEIEEEFYYIKKNGEVFGIYYDKNTIMGILNLIYSARDYHPVTFSDPERVMYISDIAMLKEYRGNGFAKRLADFSIDYTNDLNRYDYMYLRTNLEGSMSEKIFTDRGFTVMKDNGKIITQDVSFKRIGEELPSYDTRKFLVKKLVR